MAPIGELNKKKSQIKQQRALYNTHTYTETKKSGGNNGKYLQEKNNRGTEAFYKCIQYKSM